MQLRRVVVTGLGSISPIGKDTNELWKNLVEGVNGAGPVTLFNAENFKTKFACEVKDFNPTDYFGRKEARKYDRYCQFGIIAADQAVADAGLEPGNYNPDRAGVIVSAGVGGLITFQNEVIEYARGTGIPRFNPFFIPKMIADICAGHISIKYDFRGPNFATVSACASSANSIADATMYIRMGKADLFVAGGAEAAICEGGIAGFNAMHAISTRNDDPATASRPFDKNRDGFVMAEGGAVLVLEEYEHAKARGAKIYAEVIGCGLSADAYHMTAPHPEGRGAMMAMKNAIDDAGLVPTDIDYINTHGTSTPVGDASEPKAIVTLFGEHAYKLSINSTKSMTGHLLGAAGALEAIASICALNEGIIPPTINHFEDDPDIDNRLDFTFHKAKKRNITTALSNTFGFGGHNVSLLFKKVND